MLEFGYWLGILEIEVVEMCLGGGFVFSIFGYVFLNMRYIFGKNVGFCEWSVGFFCFIFIGGYCRVLTKGWEESKIKRVWFFEILNMFLIDLDFWIDVCIKVVVFGSVYICVFF